MKRIFISGASSPIGSAILKAATNKGWEAYFPDHDTLDISDELAVKLYFHTVPKLDYCVNAASFHARTPFVDQPLSTISTILTGTIYCLREFVKRCDTGAIVNITSEAARTGGRQLSVYASAKAAVNALTVSLSRELAPKIRINAVSPGIIDTPSNKSKDGSTLPMGRKGTPEEVASAVMWLLSDEASYITGAILPVAGGL